MTFRIAVIGYGFIAGMHVEAARLLPDQIDVVGVAGHDEVRADEFATKWDIETAGTDWQALCTRPDIDLIIVATPNSLHGEQTSYALSHGKHVLVEKPMAMSTIVAQQMIDLAEANGLILAVGHMWRYHPDVTTLRDRIAAGEFGRIVRTHGWGVHAGWGPSGWFTDPKLAGGGALIDMGIHAIDTARYLLGDPEPTRVTASIGTGEHSDYAVDDDGLVIIDWSNGARSLVEFGWWQPRLDGLEADTQVYGTTGAARIWTPPPAPDDYVHCAPPMYAAQLADVAAACAGGPPPIASAEVGLTALHIVEQAYESANTAIGEPNR